MLAAVPAPRTVADPRRFRRGLLAWGRANRRSFPWRETDDPFRVLVAEMLLQRSRGVTVAKVYEALFRRMARRAHARTSTCRIDRDGDPAARVDPACGDDWNQGFAIGFPFLLTVFAVVFVERLLNLRRHSMSPLQLGDVLIIATIAMAIPVLAQINFNAGQHYVSRYVAWLAAPLLVWAGLQIDRDDRLTALKGWLVGVGLYAVSYLVFFTHKIHYVLTIAPRGGPVYEDQTLFKPIAALILSAFPSLYNPWPEIFIERSLRHEVSMRPEEKKSMTTGYKGADGSYLKILTRASTADAVSQALCSAGAHLVDPGGRMLSMDSATNSALGYRYLNGAYRCQ